MSSSLTGSLLQMLGGDVMNQLGAQLGADPATTQKAVGAALPLLMGALGKNASSTDGASSLLNALTKDHDGSVLNDLSGFVSRGGNLQDGNGILRHTLGSNRSGIESALSQASGLSADSTSNLLAMLAPVVMGALGQQTRQQGLDVNGLAQLLMGEKQHATSQLGGLAGLLDMNHDGSILDEVVNIGSKLLGGLFGGKN
ncbi:MAG: DUF937 domain-containing protein [Caldilineaceae bacterium]